MSQITCGNCHQTHTSVEDVRRCYASFAAFVGETVEQVATPETDDPWGNPVFSKAWKNVSAATENQVRFLQSLLTEREHNLDVDLTRISKSRASDLITTLKGLPFRTARPAAVAVAEREDIDVPSGRYAIEHNGSLRFYKVDKVTEGRWAGRTFVKVQASDDYFPIRNREERESILREIARDTMGALRRYGHELGACGVCGRTLTDEDSRAAGIGPVCAAKF